MSNHINPEKSQFQAFREIERDGPVQMLNLIKLRKKADYEDGRQSSGSEAYKTYGKLSGPIFRALGGKIIWSGRPELMLIGPTTSENWDIAFIAEYPNVAAFVTMIRDPEYQAITHHRTAAVENSRLVRMQPSDAQMGFGT